MRLRGKDIDADHRGRAVEREMAVNDFLQSVVGKMLGIPAEGLHGLVIAVKEHGHIDCGARRVRVQRVYGGSAHGKDHRAVNRARGQKAGR